VSLRGTRESRPSGRRVLPVAHRDSEPPSESHALVVRGGSLDRPVQPARTRREQKCPLARNHSEQASVRAWSRVQRRSDQSWTARISVWRDPRGSSMSTVSPTWRPISARATGDSGEISHRDGSARRPPTIAHCFVSPEPKSRQVTRCPTEIPLGGGGRSATCCARLAAPRCPWVAATAAVSGRPWKAAFELAGLVMAREVVDVCQDVVVSIWVRLLVLSTTRTVVRVVPVELPTKRSIGVAEHPDLHYLPQPRRSRQADR
jgi:hypothetical protein